tara:strand:- start:424 stop:660 length:237 start_codon:yes stop_codon:yes gene_type:complete
VSHLGQFFDKRQTDKARVVHIQSHRLFRRGQSGFDFSHKSLEIEAVHSFGEIQSGFHFVIPFLVCHMKSIFSLVLLVK